MKQNNIHTKRAFTLIEVLLVLSLLSVISIAVYRALASGLAIWEKRSQTDIQENILIFFEKITEDLQKAVPFSEIPFEGQKKSISFAGIIKTPVDRTINDRKDEYVDQIGRIDYYFDDVKKALIRRQKNYSQTLNNKAGFERVLVEGLNSVQFEYYYNGTDAYFSVDDAHKDIPAILIVTLSFPEDKKEKKVSRTIIIPVGTSE